MELATFLWTIIIRLLDYLINYSTIESKLVEQVGVTVLACQEMPQKQIKVKLKSWNVDMLLIGKKGL